MRELYPYQSKALSALLRHKEGGALLFEPGLGKTLTAIRGSKQLRVEHRPSKVLVVCPLSAVGVWRDELTAEKELVTVPRGTRIAKAALIHGDGWIILNYEALLDKAVEGAIERWNPDLIILDEAHKIKTPTAKRSRAVHRITKDRRTWLLTGTPVTRNMLDLYSLYKAIDPGIWNDETWTQFKRRHAIFGGFEGRQVIGIQDPGKILTRVTPYSASARKEDVLTLPPRRNQMVPVYLEPNSKDYRAYKKLSTTGVLGEWVTDNPLTLALRLQQLTGMIKLPYTIDRIQELLDAEQKVVVFHRFRSEGEAIAKALGHRVYAVNGGTPVAKRESYVNAFQNVPGPAVFLGQLQATSTALTLTAAHEVIYHSLTFSYEDAYQSRDRVYRIGQTQPVRYQYMVARGPLGGKLIDDMVVVALQNKQDIAALVVAHPEILEYNDGKAA